MTVKRPRATLKPLQDFLQKGLWLAVVTKGRQLFVVTSGRTIDAVLSRAKQLGFPRASVMRSSTNYTNWIPAG